MTIAMRAGAALDDMRSTPVNNQTNLAGRAGKEGHRE
jgi:hypothetical protein